MEKNKKNTVMFLMIVILVVFNLSLLFSIWYTQIRDPKPVDEKTEITLLKSSNISIEHYLRNQLHFSEEQMNRFRKIQADHFLHANSLRTRINLLRDEIMTLLFNDNPNKSRIEELSYQLGLTHEKLEKEIFFHFMDLMDQCHPEQRESLKKLLRKVFEKYRPQTFLDVKTKGNKEINHLSDIPKKPGQSNHFNKLPGQKNELKKKKRSEVQSSVKMDRIKSDMKNLTELLNLTSKQIKQVEKILISFDTRRKEQGRQNNQNRKDSKELKDIEDQQIEAILTKEQLQKFRKFKEESKQDPLKDRKSPPNR